MDDIVGPAKTQMWDDMGKRLPAGRVAKPGDIAKVFENDAIRVLAEGQVIPAPVGQHAVENVGKTEVRTICIELKSVDKKRP